MFRHWKRPEEYICIYAVPSPLPPEANKEQWYETVTEILNPDQWSPISATQIGQKIGVLAELHETGEKPRHRRFLMIHGKFLDIGIEHSIPEPSSGPIISNEINIICNTLSIPTDEYEPRIGEYIKALSFLKLANDACLKKQWDIMIKLSKKAEKIARETYLKSMIKNEFQNYFSSIIILIKSFLYLTPPEDIQLLFLRKAEHTTHRALYTLYNHPFMRRISNDDFNSMKNQLSELLTQILINQNKIASKLEDKSSTIDVTSQHELLLDIIEKARKNQEFQLALEVCEVLVSDLLSYLMSYFKKPITAEDISSGRIAVPAVFVPLTFEQQVKNMNKLKITTQFHYFLPSIDQLSSLRSILEDREGAIEASEFYIDILNYAGDQWIINPEERGYSENLAYAYINKAKNLHAFSDINTLKKAKETLDIAEEILDKIGEENGMRARLCLQKCINLYFQRKIEGGVEICERGIIAAKKTPDSEGFIRELSIMKSQFLLHEGRLKEAENLAKRVIETSGIEKVQEKNVIANYYLDLAIINDKMGKFEEAESNLYKGFRLVITTSVFNETMMRILLSAASLYFERAFDTGLQVNLAAAAVKDVLGIMSGSDEFQIGYDDALISREVYELIIAKLLVFGEHKKAVVIADRSRARSLLKLLSFTELKNNLTEINIKTAPPQLSSDEIQKGFLIGAKYIINEAYKFLQISGLPPFIETDEIKDLAQNLKTNILIIQPLINDLQLFFILPTGKIISERSSISLEKIRKFLKIVTKIPNIRFNTEGFLDALKMLWKALFEPFSKYLKDNESLIIIPYREFTLIPFCCLIDPDEKYFIEKHSFSIVPSLAILKDLRNRGLWAQHHPNKAYILGDPKTDPKFNLSRLGASYSEIEKLHEYLKKREVNEKNIIIRLNGQATEKSYRKESVGADFVHLSCHARIMEPVYQSCLYLAPYEQYDGQLHASEIVDIKLADALVFLAACESGLGRAAVDGIIGFSRSFLQSGARGIILSLWKVQDEVTAILVDKFYKFLLDTKRSKNAPEALRQALLYTLKELRSGHIRINGETLKEKPYYWAPFLVFGDGFSIHYKV